jgi:hypothetical protein
VFLENVTDSRLVAVELKRVGLSMIRLKLPPARASGNAVAVAMLV